MKAIVDHAGHVIRFTDRATSPLDYAQPELRGSMAMSLSDLIGIIKEVEDVRSVVRDNLASIDADLERVSGDHGRALNNLKEEYARQIEIARLTKKMLDELGQAVTALGVNASPSEHSHQKKDDAAGEPSNGVP